MYHGWVLASIYGLDSLTFLGGLFSEELKKELEGELERMRAQDAIEKEKR
jgi:hypothetical protein